MSTTPGACADPSCPVLHADPANPIHPPFYEPGGPFVDVPEWAKDADSASPRSTDSAPTSEVCAEWLSWGGAA